MNERERINFTLVDRDHHEILLVTAIVRVLAMPGPYDLQHALLTELATCLQRHNNPSVIVTPEFKR